MEITFCPNPHCRFHNPRQFDPHSSWYIHYGYHLTKVVGPVRRYKCKLCGRSFSDRTFDIDYYTKRSIPYDQIFLRLVTAESVSGIGRNLEISAPSIQNRIDRLSREALALHERLETHFSLRENLVADGFESFDVSQFFPNNINILVGQDSQYLYGFTHTTIRRKGKMTREQKAKRETLEQRFRAPKAGIETSFADLLNLICRLWNKIRLPSLSLLTDEHPSYPRAISRLSSLVDALHEGSFRHIQFPSTLVRTSHNPLFPVNYSDRELRKDLSAYHRESTCFSRNVANGLGRLAIYQAWHNFIKPYRVKRPGGKLPPHGLYGGIDKGSLADELGRLFTTRSFLSHLDLREDRLNVWMKRGRTPLKEKRDYLPKYASV
jgi:transposase-like protein